MGTNLHTVSGGHSSFWYRNNATVEHNTSNDASVMLSEPKIKDGFKAVALMSTRSQDASPKYSIHPYDKKDAENEFVPYLCLTGARNKSIHSWFWWCPYEGFEDSSHVQSWIYLCTAKPSFDSLPLIPGSPSVSASTPGVVKTIPFFLPACDVFETWFDLNTYGNCYVVVESHVKRQWDSTKVTTETRPDGTTVTKTEGTITTRVQRRVIESKSRLSTISDVIATAPSVAVGVDGLSVSVSATMSGKPVLEFYDTALGYPPEVSGLSDEKANETLMNFYLSSMIRFEEHKNYSAYYHAFDKDKYGNIRHLLRWLPGQYGVSVTDTVGDGKYSLISEYINEFISDVNSAISQYGVSFYRDDSLGSDAPVTVKYGTMKSLWKEECDGQHFHGGQWEIFSYIDGDPDYIGGIDHVTVQIAQEAMYYTSLKQVCYEEFYEMLGCGWDQLEYPLNTCTTDAGGIYMPDGMTEKDRCMLCLQYSDNVKNGMDATDVGLAHNIPKSILLSDTVVSDGQSKTFSLGKLQRGHTYNVRAWIVNSDGKMSETSGWTRVVLGIKPWEWKSIGPSGTAYMASAREWNSEFFPHINAVRVYKGLPAYGAYTQNPAVSGQPMSIPTFNHAVWAISAMYPDEQRNSIISELEIKAGDTITVTQFNKLRDRLNAILD